MASTFEAILANPIIRRRLATAGGLDDLSHEQVARLVVLAFLHDFGKANSGFQTLPGQGQRAGHIRSALATLCDHELVSRFVTAVGWQHITTWVNDATALELLIASLSHHGDPLCLEQHDAVDDRLWDDAAFAEVARLAAFARAWWPAAFGPVNHPLPTSARFQHGFAGLVALSDWLGSDAELFPYDEGDGSDRLSFARRVAADAVRWVGLDGARISAPALKSFAAWQGRALRPMQAVSETAKLAPVAILESDTGSGKTESALWWWYRLHLLGLVDGLYFALPTRAAATQLHGRVVRAVAEMWGPDAPPVVLAVPGYLRAGSATGRPMPGYHVLWDDDPRGAERHERWAAESPRRYLAAAIAVGTVDQALLAALRTTHSTLRASALMRSLLIVDEVHASDAYMGKLLERLVRHHAACGGYTLALSATLGAGLRTRLLEQPLPSLAEARSVPYPALHAAETIAPRAPAASPRRVRVHLDREDALVPRVCSALADDAAVLVIRNTVAAARATTLELEAAGVSVLLHHARYGAEDRDALDRMVEAALGKGRAPGGVCVVGTQTVEQSLDIDADVLITDLCPSDVLLQRIGRMHRHQRDNRPVRWTDPQAYVLVPDGGITRILEMGKSVVGLGLVYPDLRVLQLTLEEIERRGTLVVPDDCRELIELTTHPEALAAVSARNAVWRAHGVRMGGETAGAGSLAALASIDRTKPFGSRELCASLDERVATRLGLNDIRVSVRWPGLHCREITRLSLPGYLVKGVDPESVVVGDAEITAGRWRFRYGRLGLTHERS